jgi:hypothetical protein
MIVNILKTQILVHVPEFRKVCEKITQFLISKYNFLARIVSILIREKSFIRIS